MGPPDVITRHMTACAKFTWGGAVMTSEKKKAVSHDRSFINFVIKNRMKLTCAVFLKNEICPKMWPHRIANARLRLSYPCFVRVLTKNVAACTIYRKEFHTWTWPISGSDL